VINKFYFLHIVDINLSLLLQPDVQQGPKSTLAEMICKVFLYVCEGEVNMGKWHVVWKCGRMLMIHNNFIFELPFGTVQE
jgi:hypothetical protein